MNRPCLLAYYIVLLWCKSKHYFKNVKCYVTRAICKHAQFCQYYTKLTKTLLRLKESVYLNNGGSQMGERRAVPVVYFKTKPAK